MVAFSVGDVSAAAKDDNTTVKKRGASHLCEELANKRRQQTPAGDTASLGEPCSDVLSATCDAADTLSHEASLRGRLLRRQSTASSVTQGTEGSSSSSSSSSSDAENEKASEDEAMFPSEWTDDAGDLSVQKDAQHSKSNVDTLFDDFDDDDGDDNDDDDDDGDDDDGGDDSKKQIQQRIADEIAPACIALHKSQPSCDADAAHKEPDMTSSEVELEVETESQPLFSESMQRDDGQDAIDLLLGHDSSEKGPNKEEISREDDFGQAVSDEENGEEDEKDEAEDEGDEENGQSQTDPNRDGEWHASSDDSDGEASDTSSSSSSSGASTAVSPKPGPTPGDISDGSSLLELVALGAVGMEQDNSQAPAETLIPAGPRARAGVLQLERKMLNDLQKAKSPSSRFEQLKRWIWEKVDGTASGMRLTTAEADALIKRMSAEVQSKQVLVEQPRTPKVVKTPKQVSKQSVPQHRELPFPVHSNLRASGIRKKLRKRSSSVSFLARSAMARIVKIANHRSEDLWYANPGLEVVCDWCRNDFVQAMGRLCGADGRSQFAQCEFVCLGCIEEYGDGEEYSY